MLLSAKDLASTVAKRLPELAEFLSREEAEEAAAAAEAALLAGGDAAPSSPPPAKIEPRVYGPAAAPAIAPDLAPAPAMADGGDAAGGGGDAAGGGADAASVPTAAPSAADQVSWAARELLPVLSRFDATLESAVPNLVVAKPWLNELIKPLQGSLHAIVTSPLRLWRCELVWVQRHDCARGGAARRGGGRWRRGECIAAARVPAARLYVGRGVLLSSPAHSHVRRLLVAFPTSCGHGDPASLPDLGDIFSFPR